MQIGLEKLDKLELNHNKIEELVDYCFEGLPKLTSLSIDYNKIIHVQPRAFSGLDGERCAKCGIKPGELTTDQSLSSAAADTLHGGQQAVRGAHRVPAATPPAHNTSS